MKNPNFYLESTINEIVFEDRNQAYGAYQLRKYSSRFLAVALFFGLLLTSIVTAFSLSKGQPELISDGPTVIASPIDLEPQVPVRKIERVLPPPPQQQVIQQATIAFNQMVVRSDANVTVDAAPTIDQLQNRVISTITIDNPEIGETPIINNNVITTPIVKKEDYILYPSQMPEFVGGNLAMMRWLSKNIDYPQSALSAQVEGTVFVSFIINTDGSISDATIIRGIGFGCDEEALRAISDMPKWVPGKQNAQTVRVKTTIPIKFELQHD